LKIFVPTEYEVKLEYNNIEANLRFGLGLFLRENGTVGVKPCVNYSNVRVSVPIVVARGLGYASFPLKVIAGAFALAGLMFYRWSDDPEPVDNAEEPENMLERYKDSIKSHNKSANREIKEESFVGEAMRRELNRAGLVFLAVYLWSDVVASKSADVFEKEFAELAKRGINGDLFAVMKELQGRIEANESFIGANITSEINSQVQLSSVSFSLSDSLDGVFAEAPKYGRDPKKIGSEVGVIYLLKNELRIGFFDRRIDIGRSAPLAIESK